MIRVALIILISIHGIIHLFGFLKAYGISEFNGINQNISKSSGLFWLSTFLLFTTTLVMYLYHSEYWWGFGIIALTISQVLIFYYWQDAKYGTIFNIIILVAVIIAYSNNNFKNIIRQERVALYKKSEILDNRILDSNDISSLPPIVQNWLEYSGVVGKPLISNLYLTQELHLKSNPEQKEWNNGDAEQYFTVQPPAFNWNINTETNPLMSIVGRDKFQDGKGEMLIKLLSIIPVADAKNHKKVNQAALQRYLAEIVWFPSAAISDYIKWENIDANSARATMEYNGTKGSGIFYFKNNGQFQKFVTSRYKDQNDIEPMGWTVTAFKTKEWNGIKIPTECGVTWNLDTMEWTWLKLKIKHIEYNVEKMPIVSD